MTRDELQELDWFTNSAETCDQARVEIDTAKLRALVEMAFVGLEANATLIEYALNCHAVEGLRRHEPAQGHFSGPVVPNDLKVRKLAERLYAAQLAEPKSS